MRVVWWQRAPACAALAAVFAVGVASCGRSERARPSRGGTTGGAEGGESGTFGTGGIEAGGASTAAAGGAGGSPTGGPGAGRDSGGQAGGSSTGGGAGANGAGSGGQAGGSAGMGGIMGGTGPMAGSAGAAMGGGAAGSGGAENVCPHVVPNDPPQLDPCVTPRTDCDRNARCFSVKGDDQCVCDPEFYGNGFTCDGPRAATDVASGVVTTCAVIGPGQVRCWGDYGTGALGSGDVFHNIGDDEPASEGPIASLDDPVTNVVAGENSTCALFKDGDVRCWGFGDEGQLGTGSLVNAYVPATAKNVVLGGKAVALSGNGRHTCAILDTGGLRCWGENTSGQLGYGETGPWQSGETPESKGDVALPGAVLQVSATTYATCAVVEGGDVYCWGGFNFTRPDGAQAGDAAAAGGPLDVGAKVKQVAASQDHVCVVTEADAVRCWGVNTYGQLGYGIGTATIGDDESIDSAGDVDVGGPVRQVVVGNKHTCALLTSGSVRCWGYRGGYAYGTGDSRGDDETPAEVGDALLGGTVSRLSASGNHTCALMTDGAVRCFGANAFGELGYGSPDAVGDVKPPACAGNVPLF